MNMKKVLPFILIGGLLFPVTGQAFAAQNQTASVQTPVVDPLDLNNPALQGQTLVGKKKIVEAGLRDILSRLNALSAQTQNTINQLNATGITTDQAQTALIAANTTLGKAKTDIDAFANISVTAKSGALTLSTLKYTANTAENTLGDAKKHDALKQRSVT